MTAPDSFAGRPPQGYIPQTDAVEAAARAGFLKIIPTANDLRGLWADMRCRNTEQVPVAYAEFDRWLAEHDAQVAQQTLLDAVQEIEAERTSIDNSAHPADRAATITRARAATLTA